MGITKLEKDNQAILQIDGSLTMEHLNDLKEALIACYDEYSGVVLDLKNVNECDTAGIQLLWSTRKTATYKSKSFSINAASDAIKNAAERIGIGL